MILYLQVIGDAFALTLEKPTHCEAFEIECTQDMLDNQCYYGLNAAKNNIILVGCKSLDCYKRNLSDIRATAQNAGVTVDGIAIQTNEKSRANMAQYVMESVTNGLVDVDWELDDGTYHTYTVQELKPVYKCVVNYVADCFRRSKVLAIALDDAENPATVDLTVGWPSKILTTV